MVRLEQVFVLLCSVAFVNSTRTQDTSGRRSPYLSIIFSDSLLNRRGELLSDEGSLLSTWDMSGRTESHKQLFQSLPMSSQPGKRGYAENNVLHSYVPQDTNKHGTNNSKPLRVMKGLLSSTGRSGASTRPEPQEEQQKDEPSMKKQKKEPWAGKQQQDTFLAGELRNDELTAGRQYKLRPADDGLPTDMPIIELNDMATHRPVVEILLRDVLSTERHKLKADRQHGYRPAQNTEAVEGRSLDGRQWATESSRDRVHDTNRPLVQPSQETQGLTDDISFNRTQRGTFPLLPDSQADRQSFFSPAETCRQRPLARVLRPPGCIPRLVRASGCQGTCHSRAVPQWKMERQELRMVTYCTCCSPQALSSRRVRFRCPGRPSGQLTFIQGVARQCACRPCSDAHPDLRQPYDY